MSAPVDPVADPSSSSHLWGRVLDLLLPPRCLSCGTLTQSPGGLCPACWSGMHFLGEPQCRSCGQPFEVDLGGGMVCGACLRKPPPWDRARSALAYDEASKSLILSFKHADRTDAARVFAQWMARAGGDLLAEADVLVPVPLHWTRLWSRRYNQAALLAHALADMGGKSFAPRALVRVRRTPRMGHLGAQARRRNVSGAIAPARKADKWIDGRRVLLVDDVLTSGATAGACVRALKKAGATAVDVLTLSRVVHPAS
ncbi:ComF family protein [Magnetospira thiophila]